MFFDARAVLTEILQSETPAPATPATPATQAPKSPSVSQVSQVSQGGTSENGKTQRPATPYHLDAIRQGVTDAFADFEAMNDPYDPRAWG